MGGDSLINAVSVLPLKFGQNYWVIPLLMGACSFGIRERGRWGRENIVVKRGVILNALVLLFGFGSVRVLLHLQSKTSFFFLFLAFSINSIHDIPIFAQHFTTLLSSHPLSFSSFGLYMIQQRLKKLLRGISKEWIYRICFVFEIVTLILAPLIQKEVRISWQKA